MVEYRQEFQRELEAIEAKVIEQFAMVAEDLGGATHALLSGDNEVVKVLAERDDEMDDLHASLIAELASGQMAIPVTMEMTLVARFYERLGDRAVNIARRVVYLAGRAPH